MGKHDGKVVISTALDNGGIEKDVGEISGSFGGLPNVLSKTSKAITNAFSKPVAVALAKVRALEREFERVTDEFNNAKLVDNDAAAEKYGKKQTQVYDKLLAARERLSIEVQDEAKKQSDAEVKQAKKASAASKKASKTVSKFGNRLKSIVSGALVFNIISAALRKFTQYIGKTVASTDEMKSALANLKGAASTAFAPVIEIITPAIAKLTNALATAIAKIAVFISTLTGKSISSMKETAKTIADIGDAASDTKKSLAGFDEINALSQSNGGASAGAVQPNYDFVDSVDTSWVSIFNTELETARVSVQNLVSALEPVKTFVAQGLVDFYNLVLVPIGTWVLGEGFPRFVDAISKQLSLVDWESLNGSLVNLWSSVTPFAVNVGEGLLWFWENVITPLIGWAADNLIPAALDLISEAINFLNSIIEGAEPALQWIWDNFFVPIGSFAWQAIIDFLGLLTDAFSALSDWASENKGTLSLITTIILGFLAGLWVYNTSKKIIPFISNLSASFAMLATKILEFATTSLAGALSAGFFALGFAVLLAGIIAVSAAWGKMNGAQKVITILGALAAAAIAAAIAIAVFHSSWTVGIAAAAIAGGIALLVGAFSAFGTMDFSKILSGSSSVDASSIDPKKFGVGAGNFSLPALAQGAVLPANKPFLAMVGDQKHGTNVEAPLETIKQALAEVMATQGSGDVTINFTGDLAQLARVLKPVIEKEGRRTGTSLAKGALI